MNSGGFRNIVKQFSSIFSSNRIINSDPVNMEDDINIDPVNGLILFKYFVPEEIVANILCFVSWNNLLSCRLVCQSWKRLIDKIVCFEKIKTGYTGVLSNCVTSPFNKLKPSDAPFYLCYAIAQNAFGVNHLKNSFGEAPGHTCRRVHPSDYWGVFYRSRRLLFKNCSDDCPKFKDWIIKASQGDGWIVEDIPVGSQLLPSNLAGKSCFVTSYGQCCKEQCVSLKECGLNNKIMDEIQPHIEVSEWYAKRFDCGIIYILRVFLLDSEKAVIDQFIKEVEDRHGDDEWHQVCHTFKEYGPGVRYVLFQHEGRDTQFWAGHYGSKMAGGAVMVKLDTSALQRKAEKS